ncbi:MAG: creatininase family protein [bacterium]|nr:creatininase family protein [bacterium]
MAREVRYERLRPAMIRDAREADPVAYVPVGTIEWHGLHNPVGLDTLKAHQLCIRCAQAGGGLVFPPLYYGECRDEALLESSERHRDAIAEIMGWPAANFQPGQMRRTPAEQVSAYQTLLVHMLNECRTLGFKVIVLCAGHYPLIDHARAAAATFHQQRWRGSDVTAIPIAWAFSGYELVRDAIPDAGDHAGFWETSLMLELEPDLVDLSTQPADPQAPLIGVGTKRPLREANREFGARAVKLIVERVIEQVRQRLDNPWEFYGHGLRF